MSRDSYTDAAKRQLHSVQASEWPLWLLEIDHPDLAQPARVVRDNQDLTHNGDLFVACGFELTPPDDLSNTATRANLSIDNVGKELMQWIELSGGGRGATARLLQVMRSDPNTVQFEVTMNLSRVSATSLVVSADLSFDEILNMPAVSVTYNLQTAPGLF